MSIKVKDVYDGVGGFGQGTTILFEWREPFKTTVVRYESWYTHNGSGVDFYVHETGKLWAPPADTNADLLGEFFEEVVEEYRKSYQQYVNPALEAAAAHAIAASEAMGEEPQFDGLSVDM